MAAWGPDRLTPGQSEARRRAGARLFRAGALSQAQIARQLGVPPAALSRWRTRWRHGGDRGLTAQPKSGRPARLTAAQWRRLGQLLDGGALAAGFETERWTLTRIAAVIAREFGVAYHPHALARPLRAHGVTPHRPAPCARERDEYVIAHWPTRDWVVLKKRPAGRTARSSWWTRPATPSRPAPGRPGPAAV